MPPSDLAQVVQGLPELVNENVLVCASTLDDAGVYKITDDKALVQTVDIFPPVVDDPFLYGQIVAANALSDVYAMGGTPISALNLAGFPTGQLPLEVLSQILLGGADKVAEAGACLLGGHTWNDQEVKYGIAVTGLVHPDRVVTNAGARAGNTLILTEPLGSGLVTTALRKDAVDQKLIDQMCEVMARLNKTASEIMLRHGVTACTDITGFGFLGHAREVAVMSGVTFTLDAAAVPVLDGVVDLAAQGMLPGGSKSNRAFVEGSVALEADISKEQVDVMYDAQTSGGLLIAVPESEGAAIVKELRDAGYPLAARIGTVETKGEKPLRIV